MFGMGTGGSSPSSTPAIPDKRQLLFLRRHIPSKQMCIRDRGRGALCKRRNDSVSGRGVYRSENAGIDVYKRQLQQLVDGKTDLHQLIEATLVDEDGRPRTEHGQRPSEPVSYTHLGLSV